jgi:hypothetical protein
MNSRYEAICKFLDTNNLLTMIRGHEAQEGGSVHGAPLRFGG